MVLSMESPLCADGRRSTSSASDPAWGSRNSRTTSSPERAREGQCRRVRRSPGAIGAQPAQLVSRQPAGRRRLRRPGAPGVHGSGTFLATDPCRHRVDDHMGGGSQRRPDGPRGRTGPRTTRRSPTGSAGRGCAVGTTIENVTAVTGPEVGEPPRPATPPVGTAPAARRSGRGPGLPEPSCRRRPVAEGGEAPGDRRPPRCPGRASRHRVLAQARV